VAADWHELMIARRIMRPSIARATEQWTREAAKSAVQGFQPVARKLLLTSRPAEGKRLS